MELPKSFQDEDGLDAFMSRPPEALVELFRRLPGDIAILGIAGKMGVQLGMMARQAADAADTSGKKGAGRRVIGVARFSDPAMRERLERAGVEAIPCDLLDRTQISKLPDAPNVVFMAGRKFGTTGEECETWASNVLMPGLVLEKYSSARIAAFSTACVYPFTQPQLGGSREDDPPSPVGEYAWTTLGRERIFEWGSRRYGTRVSFIRLSYAIDLRYGVLRDIAERVAGGRAIDLSVPTANVIWQGDAIAQALLSLGSSESPPFILNVSGPEAVSVRRAAEAFGRAFKRNPVFEGVEGPVALLANTQRAAGLFGYPGVPLDAMIGWTADWVARGMRSLGKPTHFDAADGRF
ncbi:MAG: NAD(P)-dependent oxidoreductase [Treponemataceae bacterium]